MPRRPRAHQLEELSRRAFAAALPPGWVHRWLDPDYGIDATVEIFDADERATGLSFHAQLKATDEPNLRKALSTIRFTREQVEYYRSVALPVLVVLFHAPSKRLFARWFHAYNPHLAVRGGRAPERKTVRFVFTDRDAWDAATPADLESGVRSFLEFRSPSIRLPLRFSLAIGPSAQTADAYPYLFGLRAALKPVAHIVAVEAVPQTAGKRAITIWETSSVVALGDVASVTVDHDPDALDDPRAHATDLAVAIAIVFARVGQASLAAEVGGATAANSSLVLDFDVAFTLARAMAQSHRVSDALHLSDALDARDDDRGDDDEQLGPQIIAGVIQTAVLERGSRNLSDDERRLAVEVGERAVNRAEARDDLRAAGAASYNLAKLHSTPDDVACYRRAAELDPTYLDRAYFHRELAGALFEAGDFRGAAQHYGEALAKGETGLCIALHADALLFSGRYADAEKQLTAYLAEDRGPERAEWRLKHRVLPRIRGMGGDRQLRVPAEAEEQAERVDLTSRALSVAEAEKLLRRALALDACCAEAWFRLSIVELARIDDPLAGLESAITSAVLYRYAVGAWVNAVRFARAASQPDDTLADLLRTAYRFNGDDFVDDLSASIQEHEGELDTELLARLDAAVHDIDNAPRPGGFTMRLPFEDGSITEFEFIRGD